MVKRAFICSFSILFLVFSLASLGSATDMGAADIILESKDVEKKKPPVPFPHKLHQDAMKCGECHHAMVDGKQAPYTEGMEVKTCASCHNPDTLGGKKKGKLKLDTYKGAYHGNCLDCHKALAKEDESKKKLKSCKSCHIK